MPIRALFADYIGDSSEFARDVNRIDCFARGFDGLARVFALLDCPANGSHATAGTQSRMIHGTGCNLRVIGQIKGSGIAFDVPSAAKRKGDTVRGHPPIRANGRAFRWLMP